MQDQLDLENYKLHPISIFVTSNGTRILEVNDDEPEWLNLYQEDYKGIKELFPEFEHPNKNATFVIEENPDNLY